MRGAWLWPTFLVLTLLDGLVLYLLPPYEEGPRTVLAGFLLAGFANLFCVAAVTPLAGRWLRRRRPDLPRAVADNYAGTALVCALAAAVLVAGLAHRPAVAAEEADRRSQLAAVHDYVVSQEPEYRAGLARVDTVQLEDEMYRSCVPGPDPKRWLCLFVDTDQHPAGIRLDTDMVSNAIYRAGGGFR
jgi:4-amino-4-deoxy-L-arabinose transferase-like glycosyltransferase